MYDAYAQTQPNRHVDNQTDKCTVGWTMLINSMLKMAIGQNKRFS